MLDYQGTGMSVMEMSHRSKIYLEIFDNAVSLLKEVMGIPDNYKILFVHGGATQQFSMVPMNFLQGKTGGYVSTGTWSQKAIKEAKRYGEVRVLASSEEDAFQYIPDCSGLEISEDLSYVHVTSNNTIYGTEFSAFPDTGKVPLIADMSSDILSSRIQVSDFGLIYGGAQKNIGPSGLGIAVVREDLLATPMEKTPVLMDYSVYAQNGSMYNTPATLSIYIAGLVFQWIKDQGGVDVVEATNRKKADALYTVIDTGEFYRGTARKDSRSRMNVTFRLPSEELEAKFVKEAEKVGLANLKGHRSVGGIRASIYNAMPLAGVEALAEFMKEFKTENG